MAAKRGLGKVYTPGAMIQAISHLGSDFDRTYRKSATRKKSKYKFNTKRTATAHQTMGRKEPQSLAELFNWNKKGQTQLDRMLELFVNDITVRLNGKAYAWAIETKAMMREVSPVLTGNLREAIKVLTEAGKTKAIGERLRVKDIKGNYSYIVGVSERAILPPPHRKRVIRGPQTGKLKDMPNYNYTEMANEAILRLKSEGYQGYDFLQKWQEIAQKNLERIFR